MNYQEATASGMFRPRPINIYADNQFYTQCDANQLVQHCANAATLNCGTHKPAVKRVSVNYVDETYDINAPVLANILNQIMELGTSHIAFKGECAEVKDGYDLLDLFRVFHTESMYIRNDKVIVLMLRECE